MSSKNKFTWVNNSSVVFSIEMENGYVENIALTLSDSPKAKASEFCAKHNPSRSIQKFIINMFEEQYNLLKRNHQQFSTLGEKKEREEKAKKFKITKK